MTVFDAKRRGCPATISFGGESAFMCLQRLQKSCSLSNSLQESGHRFKLNMDASAYHTFVRDPSPSELNFYSGNADVGVADIIVDSGLWPKDAEKNDEWNELCAGVKKICDAIENAAGIIYNVHKDILEKTSNHNHEGDKYKKKLKNCIDKAKKTTQAALIALPQSKIEAAQAMLEADIALLEEDCEHNLQTIIRDMEDLAKSKALRSRQSLVPAVPEPGQSIPKPSETIGFLPDGASGITSMINVILTDPPPQSREDQGAIPKVIPPKRTNIAPDSHQDEIIEFDPLAAAPNLANLSIGPALKTYALKELRLIYPDNIENVNESQILEWIIKNMFEPMKQLVSQAGLNSLNSEKQREHDTKIRMRSLRVGASSSIEQALIEKELEVVKRVRKNFVEWIERNVLPFKEGEPLSTDPKSLCPIIKEIYFQMTGSTIQTLSLPILEELGSKEMIKYFNQKLETMASPPDVNRPEAFRGTQTQEAGLNSRSSVITPFRSETDQRPGSRLDAGNGATRPYRDPNARDFDMDNDGPVRDPDATLNSINNSITEIDRNLESSMSDLRNLNLGGPRTNSRERVGTACPGPRLERDLGAADRGGFPSTRTSSPVHRSSGVRFPEVGEIRENISNQPGTIRVDFPDEYPRQNRRQERSSPYSGRSHRSPSGASRNGSGERQFYGEYSQQDHYRERSGPYSGQPYQPSAGASRSGSRERPRSQEPSANPARSYAQHDEYRGARSGEPAWQEHHHRVLTAREEGIMGNLESRFRIVSNKVLSLKRLIKILDKYETLTTACKRETINKYYMKIDSELGDYLNQHHEFVKAYNYAKISGLSVKIPSAKKEEYGELEETGLAAHRRLSILFDQCSESYATKEISRPQPTRADLQAIKFSKFSGRFGPRDLSFYEFKEDMEKKMEDCEISREYWGSKIRSELTDHANDIIPRELQDYDKIIAILETHFGSVPTNMGLYKSEHKALGKVPEVLFPDSASPDEAKMVKKAASEVAHDHLMLMDKVKHMVKVNPQYTSLMYGEEYLQVLLETLPSTEHLSTSALIKPDPSAALTRIRSLLEAIYNQGAMIKVTTSLEKKYAGDRREPRSRPVRITDNKPRPRIVASITEVPREDPTPGHYPPRNNNSNYGYPVPSPRARLNSYSRGGGGAEKRPEYVNETNFGCIFCQSLQKTGQGENYYHDHPHIIIDGFDKRLLLGQCPNYIRIGAVERKLLIQRTKTCPQCLKPLDNHKMCLRESVADRALCQYEGCNMARIENCILHKAQNEEKILLKQKGYAKSGLTLMMAMLPAVRHAEFPEEDFGGKGEQKVVSFAGDLSDEPTSEKSRFFYPTAEPRLTRTQLEGKRLSREKTRLNFLLFGKIKGRQNGSVVLYDSGAEVCLFGTETLEEEFDAAPIIGGLKKPLSSIGKGTVWADPWEVSLPFKDRMIDNAIETVYARDDWGIDMKNSPLERDSVFRAKRDEFCQQSSQDISNISVASDFGDRIHGIIGANVKYLFPKEVSTLSCGLTLYTTVLQPHDGSSEFLIGGPIEVLCREAGADALDASCVEFAFAIVHTLEGTLSPELRLSYHGIDEQNDEDEAKLDRMSETPRKVSSEATAEEEEENRNETEIVPYTAEIGSGLLKLDLNSVVQPNQVSMNDCMIGDAPRLREDDCGDEHKSACEDETYGKSVDNKIDEIKDAWKVAGSRELNINLNYVMDPVIIQPRCIEHVDCSPCKKEDPFESMSLALLKENQILAKCLHFNPSSYDFLHNLPFKENPYKTLQNNRSRAEATLGRAMKKLSNASTEDRETVSKSFMSLVQLGHIKEFNSLTTEQQIKIESKPINWFIPWNLVWKQSKSTPARVVFNASQKHGKYSLNDILYKGDMKTKLKLLGSLFNFARDRIGITTDISKFYNCLKLIEDNWNFQNVLWCPEMKIGGEIIRYIVTTAIYGISSASVLTEMMFTNLASRVDDDKLVYWILMYGRYVDDILGSVKDLETAVETKKKITELLAQYKIRCKGWAISGQEPDESVAENGVVGVGGYPFHVKEDVIQIKIPPLDFSGTKARGQLLGSVCFEGKTLDELNEFVPKQLTIRQALSKTSSIFDPRGIISPYTLLTKLAFQDSIQSLGGFGNEVLDKSTKKLNKKVVLTAKMWDLPLPKKQRAEWVRLFFMAEQIREFKYPRFPIPENIDTSECYLFGYGDAANPGSQECVHIAFSNDDNCFYSFHLMGKNQVHSAKEAVRIPYKEMTAMTLTAGLLQKCKLALPNVKGMKLFSDSEISLHWVRENGPDINNYIRARCQIVRNYIDLDSLYHIRGNYNISDKGTRQIKDVAEISPSSSFYLGPDCMRDFKKSIDEGIITPLSKLKRTASADSNEADAHVDKSELMEDHLIMAPLISPKPTSRGTRKVRNYYKATAEEEEAMMNYVQDCLDEITTEQIVNAYCNITGKKPAVSRRRLPIELKFKGLGGLQKTIESLSNCWFKICRILGWILKACDLFNKNSETTIASCIQKAKILLLQSGIDETEKMIKERPIKGFIQTKDNDGLIRVQTRITPSKLDGASLIVVSPSLPIAAKILFSYHCVTHSGTFGTVSKSRVFFWIPHATKLARKIIRSCTKCRLLDAERLSQLMAPIPSFRTRASPPWYFTMVDLFGPIKVRGFVKRRTLRKTWAVIFTCLYTRAVWAYLAESYDTNSFLNVIRKHEARNGSAAVYYADLGSQIKGADKTMQEAIRNLDKKALLKFSAKNNTTFKFGIPLHSAGQGPVERLIKEMKRCIKIISEGTGTFAETETMLFEASYMVNSRPLQFHPRAGEDGFICPNDILFGRSTKDPPALDFENCNLAQRSAQQQKVMAEFWEQWSTSYLQGLHRYQRWTKGERNLKPGDLVLVLDKEVFPGKFLTGEVTSVVVANDNKVRRVDVQYKLHPDDGKSTAIKTRKFRHFERSPHGLALLLSIEERDVIGIPLADLDGELQNNEPITIPEAKETPIPESTLAQDAKHPMVNFNGKMIKMKKCEVRLSKPADKPKAIELNGKPIELRRCEVKLKRLPASIVKQSNLQ